MHFDHVAALFLFEISILADYASGSFEFLDSFIRRNRCIDGFYTWICNEHVYLVFDGFGFGEYFTLWFSVIGDVFRSQI